MAIILRISLYVFIMSRVFNVCLGFNFLFTILVSKIFLDLCICSFFYPSFLPAPSDGIINFVGNIVMCINIFFFAYFYAKICGIYKKLENVKLWNKLGIFLIITILVFVAGIIDFKHFNFFQNLLRHDICIEIIVSAFFIIPALLLNCLFNFLTKKFPVPFKKIGYIFSVEFFKDLFKMRFKNN